LTNWGKKFGGSRKARDKGKGVKKKKHNEVKKDPMEGTITEGEKGKVTARVSQRDSKNRG